MGKKNLTAKKRVWSSDNVVVIRRRPKAKPVFSKTSKIIQRPSKKKKSGHVSPTTVKPKPKADQKPKSKKIRAREMRTFGKGVLIDLNRVLPPQPFKIGITKDIFEVLRANYPNQHTKLRKALKFYLKHKTQGRHYLKALIIGDHRNGLNGEKYEITKEHREHAKKLLIEKVSEYDRRKKN